jgi:hypothetical protein
MPHIRLKLKQNKLSATWNILSLSNSHKSWNPLNWCATCQVDKLNNENFFLPGTVYVPGCLCNVF